MLDVIGQMRLTLRVGQGDSQREIPINPSLLDRMDIIQNNLLHVPVTILHFHDTVGLQQSVGNFVDGTPFSIDIGWNQNDEPYRSHPFRLYTIPEQLSDAAGTMLKLQGYLDIPKYFRKRYQGFTGTSWEVMKNMADDNKLIIDPPENNTNDIMSWLPDGRSQSSYAKYVTNHAWAGDTSCMELAITQIPDELSQRDTNNIPWMVRYFDIVAKIRGDLDYVLTNAQIQQPTNPPTVFHISDLNIKNHSGFFNNWIGYGNRVGQEQLDGSYLECERTDILRSMRALELNQELREELGVVRREVAPMDCGNTHPNYIKARHQNRRIKSQFSTVAEVVTIERTPIRIFDKVQLVLTIPQTNEVSEAYQGDYIVTAKTISIRGGAYREKFELAGQGVNRNIDNLLT